MADLRVRVGGRVLHMSDHAIERYHERVAPHRLADEVRAELERLLTHAEWVDVAPAWVETDRRADGFVMLGDGIAFPVLGRAVVSCLTRSGRGEVAQEARRYQRTQKRTRRREKGREPFGHKSKAQARAMRDKRRDRQAERDAL